MSTRLKEKEEKILQLLEGINEEAAKGKPIIVEGKKDIAALKALAIEGKIITAKTGGKSFLELISEIERTSAKEVILLLDFDRRGKELTGNLKRYMEKTGIKTNTTFWSSLLSLVGKEVKDVEGLAAYMETLKSKICNS
ncbi:MAG: toprim domain-containing protein [Candidatus Bathyarchaeales archaeon]